jgi:hypothetical protein
MPNNTTDARHQEALRLRNTGMSYGAIARALGYGNYPSAARYAVMAALRNQVSTSSNTVRQFGVEAEFYGITPTAAIIALEAVGITATFEGYTHAVMSNWKIVTDASVTDAGTGRGTGLELVSPILKGEEGLQELAKALDALRNAGAKVNTTCGLHVHIDTLGMNGIQRKNFFNSYVRNQDVMDRLVSVSRRDNRRYTARYTTAQANSYAEAIALGNDGGSRFYTVNICSFQKYGTLEFRQHQGTLSGKKAVAWVKMLLAMAETAQASTLVSEGMTTYGTVAELLSAHNVDESATRVLLTREAQLNRQSVAA